MKNILIMVLAITAFVMCNPTHYIDGTWYECEQTDYDSKGNKIREENISGDETLYKWFGSKATVQVLKCHVGK